MASKMPSPRSSPQSNTGTAASWGSTGRPSIITRIRKRIAARQPEPRDPKRPLTLPVPVRDGETTILSERFASDPDAGRRLSPFVLVVIDKPGHPHHQIGVETVTDDVLHRPILLDVTGQDLVQKTVGRQTVAVLLVRSQLCRRCFVDDRPGYHLAFGVSPLGQPVYQRLEHILEYRITTSHVPVEGGVPHCHLRLVTGGHHHMTELVGESHNDGPTNPCLQVLFRHPESGARKSRVQSAQKRGERVIDR